MFTNNNSLELEYYNIYEDLYHPKFWDGDQIQRSSRLFPGRPDQEFNPANLPMLELPKPNETENPNQGGSSGSGPTSVRPDTGNPGGQGGVRPDTGNPGGQGGVRPDTGNPGGQGGDQTPALSGIRTVLGVGLGAVAIAGALYGINYGLNYIPDADDLIASINANLPDLPLDQQHDVNMPFVPVPGSNTTPTHYSTWFQGKTGDIALAENNGISTIKPSQNYILENLLRPGTTNMFEDGPVLPEEPDFEQFNNYPLAEDYGIPNLQTPYDIVSEFITPRTTNLPGNGPTEFNQNVKDFQAAEDFKDYPRLSQEEILSDKNSVNYQMTNDFKDYPRLSQEEILPDKNSVNYQMTNDFKDYPRLSQEEKLPENRDISIENDFFYSEEDPMDNLNILDKRPRRGSMGERLTTKRIKTIQELKQKYQRSYKNKKDVKNKVVNSKQVRLNYSDKKDDLLTLFKKPQNTQSILQETLNSITQEINNNKQAIIQKDNEISELRNQIYELKDYEDKYIVTKSLVAKFQNKISKMKKKLLENELNINELTGKRSDDTNTVASLKRSLELKAGEIGVLIKDLDDISAKYKYSESQNNESNIKIRELELRLKKNADDFNDLVKNIKFFKKELKDNNSKIKILEDELYKASDDKRRLDLKLSTNEVEIENYKRDQYKITELENQIEYLEKSIEDTNNTNQDLNTKLSYLQDEYNLLKDKNTKTVTELENLKQVKNEELLKLGEANKNLERKISDLIDEINQYSLELSLKENTNDSLKAQIKNRSTYDFGEYLKSLRMGIEQPVSYVPDELKRLQIAEGNNRDLEKQLLQSIKERDLMKANEQDYEKLLNNLKKRSDDLEKENNLLKLDKDEEIRFFADQLKIQEDKQRILNSEIRDLTDQLKVSEERQQLLNSEIQMLNNRENDTKNQLKLSKEKENWLEARIGMLEKESEEAKYLIVQLDLCKDEQELLTQKILKLDKDENNLRIQLKKFEEDDKLLRYRINELDDKNDNLENKLEKYREYVKGIKESFDMGMFLLKKGSATEIEQFQEKNIIPYELGLELIEKYVKNTQEIAPSMLYSVLKLVKSKNPKKIEKLAELLKEKELVSDNYRNASLNIKLLRENTAFDMPSYYFPISDEARNFIINFLSARESSGTPGYLINTGKLLAATIAYLLLSGNNPGPGSITKS